MSATPRGHDQVNVIIIGLDDILTIEPNMDQIILLAIWRLERNVY
jgi:hypothetical protein